MSSLSPSSNEALDELIFWGASSSANGANGDQAVRNDPKLTQCLRVATTALRESIPATSSSAKRAFYSRFAIRPLSCTNSIGQSRTATANNLQRHVMYTRAVFSLYADVADVFPSPMREELYAIAFHFFSRKFSRLLYAT